MTGENRIYLLFICKTGIKIKKVDSWDNSPDERSPQVSSMAGKPGPGRSPTQNQGAWKNGEGTGL